MYKKYFNWESRLEVVNRYWIYEIRRVGWSKRFDCVRRTWADTGKQIKGGIGNMENDIKNERIRMHDLREMLNKQNHQCPLTGRELTPDNCSIDHVIPLSKGGSHTKDNAQLVVAEVNHAKGNLTEEEFLQLCRDVVVHAGLKK